MEAAGNIRFNIDPIKSQVLRGGGDGEVSSYPTISCLPLRVTDGGLGRDFL